MKISDYYIVPEIHDRAALQIKKDALLVCSGWEGLGMTLSLLYKDQLKKLVINDFIQIFYKYGMLNMHIPSLERSAIMCLHRENIKIKIFCLKCDIAHFS